MVFSKFWILDNSGVNLDFNSLTECVEGSSLTVISLKDRESSTLKIPVLTLYVKLVSKAFKKWFEISPELFQPNNHFSRLLVQ